jgi:Double-GTPase 1
MAEVVGIFIALIVLALVARAVANKRKVRQLTTALAESEAVPTFRVVALGVAGSGKTVFLASMFHRLHIASPGGSYFLETAADDRVRLNSLFQQVERTDLPWPRGTRVGETREFTFDCMAVRGAEKRKVLSLNYLDYAGELLEAEQEGPHALADLARRISEAHALLAIIDGHRVLQCLRGEPAGQQYFRSTIQPMIGFLAAATCPIHFVLTKWDLVRDFGEPPHTTDDERLRMVRDQLCYQAEIGPIVERQNSGSRVVRLIPVSAVGDGFVRLDHSGNIVKVADRTPRPTNLEVPLSAVLPDLFKQAEAALAASRRARRVATGEIAAAIAQVLSVPAGMLLQTALHIGTAGIYSDAIAATFVDWMRRPAQDGEAAEQNRNLVRQLRTDVLKEFEFTVNRLEYDMSYSRLTAAA